MLRQHIHPDDVALFEQTFTNALENGAVFELEHRVTRPDGEVRWVRNSAYPYFIETGQLSRYIGTTLDITEQRQTQEALRANKERFQLFMDNSPTVAWVKDENGRYVYLNKAFERSLMLRPADLIGKTDFEIWPEKIASIYRRSDVAVLDSGQSVEIMEEAVNRQEVRSFWWLYKFPYKDSTGLRYVAGIGVDITDKKIIEEKLVQERNMLQHVMNGAINAHLVYLDRDFNYIRVNEAYAATCGYSAEEMVGTNHFVLYPHAENEAIFKRVRDSGVPFTVRDKPFECPYQADRTYWDWTLNPVKDTSGVVTGLVYSLFETTERKRAAEEIIRLNTNLEQQVAERTQELEQALAALQASEHRYRTVVEDQTEIISRYLPQDNTLTFINETYCRFFGKSQEELLGQCWCPVAVAEDVPRIKAALATLSLDNPVVTIENRVYDRTGAIRWVQFSNRGIFDEQEQLLEIQSVGRDITERIENERRLRQAEAYARNLIEVNLDPIVTIDALGKISDVNKASSLATGSPREEMIGTDFSSYFTEPDLAEAVYQQVFKTGMVQDYPLEIRHRDGHVTPVVCNATLFRDENQEVAGVFAAARDVTKLKHVEEQLRLLNTELEHKVEERTRELQETQKQVLHAEKLSAIGMLAASIAHEFNNPLQSVMVILNGLRKWATLEEKEKELVDAAISECVRMKSLIRSLQDFNRPSSGMKTLMDVHQELDSLILLQTNIFSKKLIEIERVYAADLPSIEAVPDQIKQVFLNLLTNACDACSIGKNKITISTWREGDRVAVSVVDTGVGITPENLERIFQPFFSTKDTVKGTGLGLSVSHGIIQAHGGEIRVESSPGKGAAFTVILPIY